MRPASDMDVRKLLILTCLKTSSCGKSPEPPAAPVQVSDDGFERQGPPLDGEWRSRFKEEPQSFETYAATCANRATPERRVFYLQPLGDAAERYRDTIAAMRDYSAVFFGVEARVCDPIPMIEEAHVLPRDQYNGSMAMERLAERLPADALVYVGITEKDLFARGLNFIFGQGSLENRTGIYSLVRYQTDDARLFLRRSLKLLSHEAGHILSLQHCLHYRCVMQGANSLWEGDRHPMHLCPVDLRKLQWNTGFDATDRYRKLGEFYRRHGLTEEADWAAARLR